MSDRRIFWCGTLSRETPGLQTIREEVDRCDFAALFLKEEATQEQASDVALCVSRSKPVAIGTKHMSAWVLCMAADYVFGHCDGPDTLARLATAAIDHNPKRSKIWLPWSYKACAILDKCQSPAEVRLAVHLLQRDPGFPATLEAQRTIDVDGKSYRADFALVSEDDEYHPVRIVIEVDGHDYHERTKKQAARDRSRDRSMITNGWHVLRFTGSEVWADPGKCAEQVEDFSNKVAGLDDE